MNINSRNPYFCKWTRTCPQKNVMFPCSKWTKGHPELGASFREGGGEEWWRPTFALATKNPSRHWSVVSCVRCVRCDGDGRWAWIPGGGLRSAPFPPPTSDWGNETEGSPIGLRKNFEVRLADKFPYQKYSISNLWEHFLVSEHRKPFWSISYWGT